MNSDMTGHLQKKSDLKVEVAKTYIEKVRLICTAYMGGKKR